MLETIDIYYRPIDQLLGMPTDVYSHTFLLYTNKYGKKYIFSAGPEKDLNETYDPAVPGLLGRLWAEYEPLSEDSYDAGYTKKLEEHSVERYTLARDADLSSEWRNIGQVYEKIISANINYGIVTDNSNSAVQTAATEAGLKIPLNRSLEAAPGIKVNLADKYYYHGDDTFAGRFDGIRIAGYDGIDTVDYSAHTARISVQFWPEEVTVGTSSHLANDTLIDIERIIGTDQNDVFAFIYNPAYQNSLQHIDAGEGTDKLTISRGQESLTIDLAEGQVSSLLNGKHFTIENIEDVTASWGNDTIVGTDDANTLRGEAGDDVLRGEGGKDMLFGGEGNDALFGGQGDDMLFGRDQADTLNGDAGNDLINGDLGDDRLWGGEGSDTLSGGAGDDRLYGEDGNDRLYGGQGDDFLDGGAGDDRIICLSGNSTATGGEGADDFEVSNANTTLVVTDFEMESDRLYGPGKAEYSDGAGGLHCSYKDGSSAILSGITMADAEAVGWVI